MRDSNSFTLTHIPRHKDTRGRYLSGNPQTGTTCGDIEKHQNASLAAQESAQEGALRPWFGFSQTNVDKPGYLESPLETSCTRNTSSLEVLGLRTLNKGVVLA